MASSSTDNAMKEIKKYYRKFVFGLCTRLVDIIDKREYNHNSTPELNRIAQAVLTLSYIFRVKYRHTYFNVHSKITDNKHFTIFCDNYFQVKNFPHFFAFLLNVSMKFEFFLYAREEGYNYFGIFVMSLLNYPDYLYFVLLGGAEKLSRISWFFLNLTKDLQILVNTEYPCRRNLLSFEESIHEIQTKYIELSSETSFACLQAISKDLYSGLQEYVDEPVLPFIILRFLLDGRVPQPTGDDDDSSALYGSNKSFIMRYFSRCLVPDIISGAAYKGRTRRQLRLSMGVQEAYENYTNLNPLSSGNESRNITIKEWLPLTNNVSDKDLVEEAIDSDDTDFVCQDDDLVYQDDDFVCQEENEASEKEQVKEFHSNLSGSETPSLETGCSSVEKVYGNGLEWLKRFNTKTESLLNADNLGMCHKGHFSEDNSSKNICVPLGESAAQISSVKGNLGVRQKEKFSNNACSEEKNCVESFSLLTLSSRNNSLNESKKRSRKKQKKKFNRVEKSDSDDSCLNIKEKSDAIAKLRDTFISAVHRTSNLHSWEKKCIFFFLDKAENLSMREKVSLCKKIEKMPAVQLIDFPSMRQMMEQKIDLMMLDIKSDLLNLEYVQDKCKNSFFNGEIPFPEFKANIRVEFVELVIRLLAVSCDKNIQTALLGPWLPVFQIVLQKNKYLLSHIADSGPNDFLKFLSDHSSQ